MATATMHKSAVHRPTLADLKGEVRALEGRSLEMTSIHTIVTDTSDRRRYWIAIRFDGQPQLSVTPWYGDKAHADKMAGVPTREDAVLKQITLLLEGAGIKEGELTPATTYEFLRKLNATGLKVGGVGYMEVPIRN